MTDLPAPAEVLAAAAARIADAYRALGDARDQGRAPAWPLPEAVRRVLRHCEHARMTVDEMAELIRRETPPPT